MEKRANSEIRWNVNAKVDSRPIVRTGVFSIGVTLIVFLLWGSFAHLESAVITPGTLVSEGRNKLIQHSVGGRVKRIFVREGMHLDASQVVLELDPTTAKADLSRLEARHASLSALKTRLQAERTGGSGFKPATAPHNTFQAPNLGGLRLGGRGADDVLTNLASNSLQLRGAHDAEPVAKVLMSDAIANAIVRGRSGPSSVGTVAEKSGVSKSVNQAVDPLMESQKDAYDSGRDLLTKEITALERKAETLQQQKAGHSARIRSQQKMLTLIRQEINRLKPLASEGYIPRNRIQDKERLKAELEGNVAAMKLESLAFDTQKAEIDVQIERAAIARSDAAAKEYASIIAELAEIEDQRNAARATVRDTIVRAPVSGTLTKLNITTEGGVFGGGDVVGEIVPDGAPLVVEARVQPSDIDFVRIGQEADIAITAFDRRLDDTLTGIVSYVSADAQKDDKTGDQYFVARLRFDDRESNTANLSKLQAGMQGEVYIHTGSRTFITYLTKPLLDSFRRAFRER